MTNKRDHWEASLRKRTKSKSIISLYYINFSFPCSHTCRGSNPRCSCPPPCRLRTLVPANLGFHRISGIVYIGYQIHYMAKYTARGYQRFGYSVSCRILANYLVSGRASRIDIQWIISDKKMICKAKVETKIG